MDKYQQHEYAKAVSRLNALSFNHLGDRQQARDDYHEALKSPGIVAERAEWLLAGHYGEGPYLVGLAIIEASNRSNKVAALSIAIAGFEWNCPARFARQAYLNLSKAEQSAIDSMLAEVIREAE